MKDGFCPKCGSNEVIIKKRRKIEWDSFARLDAESATAEDYLCLHCGYLETYLMARSLNKQRAIQSEQELKRKRKNDEG